MHKLFHVNVELNYGIGVEKKLYQQRSGGYQNHKIEFNGLQTSIYQTLSLVLEGQLCIWKLAKGVIK